MLTKKRLLTPGPTMLPERVRLAMAQDMIHHRKPVFKEILSRVQFGLQELFGTKQPVLCLSASGTGSMVAAVTNLFAQGEKVLVIDAGKFAKRWENICITYGIEVITLDVEWGFGAEPEALEAALDAHPDITGVFVQLSETSTGAMHPIKELAQVASRKNVLFIVDGISGVSISPCPMDKWGIDCLITGSQKGLMLPPGLALLSLSEKAWKKRERIGCRDFYFDLVAERESTKKQQTHFTSPVGLIIGLDESLTMFKEVGFEQIYRKQWALTMMVREGVTAMGLELFAKKHFAWGVTSVLMPPKIDAEKVLSYAAKHYGIIMAAGQDEWKKRIIRIGHMGWVDYGDLAAALFALAASIRAFGGSLANTNYLEKALDTYNKAYLEDFPGDTSA